MGLPINQSDDYLSDAIKLHQNGGGQIVTLNTEMAVMSRKNKDLYESICKADIVIPESIGISFALTLKGVHNKKTPGIEISWELLQYAEKEQWIIALIGGSKIVNDKLQKRLLKELPKLRIGIAEHGYHPKAGWLTIENKLKFIQPDLVLIGLGTPFQEIWAMKTSQNSKGLWIGVGGSFDVWADIKKRAPKWVRAFNLEWLFRMIKEPQRLRRFFALPSFALALMKSLRKF